MSIRNRSIIPPIEPVLIGLLVVIPQIFFQEKLNSEVYSHFFPTQNKLGVWFQVFSPYRFRCFSKHLPSSFSGFVTSNTGLIFLTLLSKTIDRG
jgi:hypothetical protein